MFYYLEVRCWINSPLGSSPDVRQCFQLHVCQVEREPAWIATRHVIKKVCSLFVHAHVHCQGQTPECLKQCAPPCSSNSCKLKYVMAKQCFTNVSTEYLLYAPPAGDVLFGVALERLTWAPGEAVCFDFVAESYSGIEFTRIQVHCSAM